MARPAIGVGLAGSLVAADPSQRVHAVRTVGRGIGRGAVAGRTFGQLADVPLPLHAGHVVVAERAGKLRVRRAMAGRAVQPAVPLREAEQRIALRRRVAARGKPAVHRHPHRSVGVEIYVVEADLAAVGHGVAGVARLAIRLVEPTGAVGRADHRHRAVAVLALHGQRAVGRHGPAHRAAQAPRLPARMAAIAGRPVVGQAQQHARVRIGHSGMQRVHGLGQRRHARLARTRNRLRMVAGRAQEGFAVPHHRGIEPGDVEPLCRQNVRIGRRHFREPLLIVQLQDVQPVIASRNRIPLPVRGGSRGRTRTRGMAGPAVHFHGNRQHDVGRGRRHGTGGRHVHQGIRIQLQVVVVRRDRHPPRHEPARRAFIIHRFPRIARARHRRPGRGSRQRQTLVRRQRRAQHLQRKIPEIVFPDGRGVD